MSYEVKSILSSSDTKVCMTVSFNGGKDEYYEIENGGVLDEEVIDQILTAVSEKSAIDNAIKPVAVFEVTDGKATVKK